MASTVLLLVLIHRRLRSQHHRELREYYHEQIRQVERLSNFEHSLIASVLYSLRRSMFALHHRAATSSAHLEKYRSYYDKY